MVLLEQPGVEYDPGEIEGMRSAGVILLVSAVLTIAAFAMARQGSPVTAGVDVFLGVQLLRLRHSWRAWAMLRAGIGLLATCVLVFVSLASSPQPVTGALAWLAQGAYCSSLLLLLYGNPSNQRIRAGRLAFGGFGVLTLAAFVAAIGETVMDLSRQPDAGAVGRDLQGDSRGRASDPPTTWELMSWDLQLREQGTVMTQTALLWKHLDVSGPPGVFALVQAKRTDGDGRWRQDGYKEFAAAPSAAEVCHFMEALTGPEADVEVLSRVFVADAWLRRTGEAPPCRQPE